MEFTQIPHCSNRIQCEFMYKYYISATALITVINQTCRVSVPPSTFVTVGRTAVQATFNLMSPQICLVSTYL